MASRRDRPNGRKHTAIDTVPPAPDMSSKIAKPQSEMLGVENFLCKVSKILQYGQLTSHQPVPPVLVLKQGV